MDMEFIFFLMEESMKEVLGMGKNMDGGFSLYITAGNMTVNLRMGKSMELEL